MTYTTIITRLIITVIIYIILPHPRHPRNISIASRLHPQSLNNGCASLQESSPYNSTSLQVSSLYLSLSLQESYLCPFPDIAEFARYYQGCSFYLLSLRRPSRTPPPTTHLYAIAIFYTTHSKFYAQRYSTTLVARKQPTLTTAPKTFAEAANGAASSLLAFSCSSLLAFRQNVSHPHVSSPASPQGRPSLPPFEHPPIPANQVRDGQLIYFEGGKGLNYLANFDSRPKVRLCRASGPFPRNCDFDRNLARPWGPPPHGTSLSRSSIAGGL